MKAKTVFVVVRGELCEGGEVVSVHKSHKDAVKAAMAVKTCFDGGWVLEEGVWVNGCDFVQVTEETVR